MNVVDTKKLRRALKPLTPAGLKRAIKGCRVYVRVQHAGTLVKVTHDDAERIRQSVNGHVVVQHLLHREDLPTWYGAGEVELVALR